MKNKKEILTMLKEAGILFGITLMAGLLLGFVYELTKEPRRLQQEKAIQEACVAVFPEVKEQGRSLIFTPAAVEIDAEMSEKLTENSVEVGTVFEAKSEEGFYGYVVEATSSKGYGGDIVLYVGVNTEGRVCGASITKISETAGLGMEAPTVLIPQYAGKLVDKFLYTKNGATADNEVDAISGATKTTKAVNDAVNAGLSVALKLLEGGGENE